MFQGDGSPKEARRGYSVPGYPRVRTAQIGLEGTGRLKRVCLCKLDGNRVVGGQFPEPRWRVEDGGGAVERAGRAPDLFPPPPTHWSHLKSAGSIFST